MFILSTNAIDWRIAKKTKPLRAKPMLSVLVDRSILAKFLVDTLEAREPVKASAVICIGEHNDAWQQAPEKLLAKYDVTAIDDDGFMVCKPKPENSVEFFEVTKELLVSLGQWEPYCENGYGFIVGQWGETIEGQQNLQKFVVGDAIARNREDPSDQWRVAAKIWRSTYSEISQ